MTLVKRTARRQFRIVLMFSLTALAAGPPPAVQSWSRSALKQIDAEMTATPRNKGLAVKTIGVIGIDPSAVSTSVQQFPANALLLVDRISTGESEIHTTQSDVMNIMEGAAALITGGKLTEERKISDTEIRGTSLTGTEQRPVKAGDVIVIKPRPERRAMDAFWPMAPLQLSCWPPAKSVGFAFSITTTENQNYATGFHPWST
jgi:hypothetical protein